MIKNFLLSTIAVCGFAGVATAADMPLKAVAPAAYVYDWSGIYIGGVAGGAWGTHDLSSPSLGVVGTLVGVPVVQTNNPSAFIGGIEIGSRYQFGKLVVGWEGDVTWGDVNNTSTVSFGGPLLPPGSLTRSLSTNVNWTGTGTATIGIAHNNWLLYGKAGAAVENVDYTATLTANLPPVLAGTVFTGTGSDKNRVGWTVGTGLEWAFYNNWSVKAEYDYLDFGNRNVAINGSLVGLPIQFGLQDNNHVNQFKAGLNYKFMPNFW